MARHSLLDAEAVKREFSDTALPDPRLSPRLDSVVELMSQAPGASFSKMCSNEAEREGLYRFLRNSRVECESLIEPHQLATAERARRAGHVLAIHDTTEMRLADEAEIDSWLSTKKRGFRTHLSLVVDARERRRPIGIAAVETIERKNRTAKTKKNGRRLRGDETAKLEDKEYARWARGVARTSELLEGCQVTHVMDAEADSYALLAAMCAADQSFVVRQCQSRSARSPKSNEWERVQSVVENAKEFKRTRTVRVSKRRAKRAPQAAKAKPARKERTAELTLAFTKVVLRRPRYVQDAPDELTLCVVRAYEKNAPEGETPIDWLLLTNIDVSSKGTTEQVIDIYRQRWLAEEFFKVLKTGCGFRKRRLTNRQSIYNSLMLLLPVAWRALLLRQTAHSSEAPASEIFSELELEVLRAWARKNKKNLTSELTAKEALYFLAETGGYRPSKKRPPGWETLIEGLQKFEALVEGWTMREGL